MVYKKKLYNGLISNEKMYLFGGFDPATFSTTELEFLKTLGGLGTD